MLISGSGFISGGLHGVVQFTGAFASTVYSYTNTSIVVAVPAGATTGPVFLELVNVNSNSMTFTVSAPTTPTIISLTPSSGGIGIPVTIAGTNFGATQGASVVTFNGIAATVSSWSASTIVATVPLMATTGPVIVTVAGVASNSMTFTVTNPSNGGMAGPLNLLVIPCQQFGAQEVQSFNPFDFNDLSFGSFYSWKVEEIAAARMPTCSRQMITYRDLGVAILTASLGGTISPVGDDNIPTVSTISETFKIGTAGATGKLFTILRSLELTAQNLQYTITRGAGAGPVSITKVRLEGRVEMTAYA